MIVVGRRSTRDQPSAEPIIPGAQRVEHLRVHEVLLNPQLSIGDHIDRAVSSCTSSKFALRTRRSHDLRPLELHLVARATTVASLQYTSSAWWGSATEEQRNRLERLSFIHSFWPFLSRPFTSFTTQRRSRLQHRYCIGVSRRSAQAIVGIELAQGPCVAARAGVEPTTLRLKVIASTNAPPRPTSEGAPKMWLPVDLRLFKSSSSHTYHVLRHYLRKREPTG